MSKLTSKAFVIDAIERAIATGAQVLLGFLVGSTVATVDWKQAGVVAGSAVVASLLKSIVAGVTSIGDPNASLVDRQILDAEIDAYRKRNG